MTPMMEQYFEVKNQYKDYLLFYRLGDFYEMFFDDAIVASRELELTLTGRDCGEEKRAPMCGVPFHSAEGYIGRLIEKGYKVAICEQVEDPATAKGLVKREVIRVVTPGTIIESNLLQEGKNNYICAIYVGENEFGLCYGDISTAQVYATSGRGGDMVSEIINALGSIAPSEIVLNLGRAKLPALDDFMTGRLAASVTDQQPQRYEWEHALQLAQAHFGESMDEKTRADKSLLRAVGAFLDYVGEMQKSDLAYIKELHVYSNHQYLEMDVNTRRNLELTSNMRTKEKKGTLLWVLDKTKTAPGARMLRQWIEHPLLHAREIDRRQSAVEELFGNFMLRENLLDLLSGMHDLERLITRIVYGTAGGKDLRAVAGTIGALPELRTLLQNCQSEELKGIYESMDELADVYTLIDAAIQEDPPFSVREGDIIRAGYSKDVDDLRAIMHDGKGWIERVAAEEREATGIRTLKIGYNKVFGYYIEVTKSLIHQVPDRYIRKQTLANCERYITQELKDMEATILGASDKVCSLEYDLFQEVRARVAESSERIQKTAELIARIDVYVSLAGVAARNKYIRPEVDSSTVLQIKDGRHPVVEQFVKNEYFVPNDTTLDLENNRIMLITGPNMAGKSTYMRQVALIVLMAQIGSFVPANEARIGLVDKIFTRVGASDDLASGQSTFMLEMNEVAYILKNATRNSLIIYDEVGRGTSTFDGMSIARAIIEHTYSKKIGAKTLFATHYHELTVLEDEYKGIVNYNIAAKKRGDNILFLRKIVRGSTDDSYGIEVAKLAGVPGEVIKRAKEILAVVERTSQTLKTSDDGEKRKEALSQKDESLITMDDCIRDQVMDDLKATDINALSPYEAMTLLYNLQKRLK
ncbi:MAG: DNA mismatch repair protein MutS [Clostridia bacterium]|nr:DNA mismatch repair protein MutS [Clostridia bacterium]